MKAVEKARHDKIQGRELEWWANTVFDPRLTWNQYDRVFLPFLSRKFYDVAVDVGSGPAPYPYNHNVLATEICAVDPLILEYMKIERYCKYRVGPALVMATDISEVAGDVASVTFCLNTLDHVRDPEKMIAQLARITAGQVFVFCDIGKEPDQMHPHEISGDWLLRSLLRLFHRTYFSVKPSWKFDNDTLWFIGRKK